MHPRPMAAQTLPPPDPLRDSGSSPHAPRGRGAGPPSACTAVASRRLQACPSETVSLCEVAEGGRGGWKARGSRVGLSRLYYNHGRGDEGTEGEGTEGGRGHVAGAEAERGRAGETQLPVLTQTPCPQPCLHGRPQRRRPARPSCPNAVGVPVYFSRPNSPLWLSFSLCLLPLLPGSSAGFPCGHRHSWPVWLTPRALT